MMPPNTYGSGQGLPFMGPLSGMMRPQMPQAAVQGQPQNPRSLGMMGSFFGGMTGLPPGIMNKIMGGFNFGQRGTPAAPQAPAMQPPARPQWMPQRHMMRPMGAPGGDWRQMMQRRFPMGFGD